MRILEGLVGAIFVIGVAVAGAGCKGKARNGGAQATASNSAATDRDGAKERAAEMAKTNVYVACLNNLNPVISDNYFCRLNDNYFCRSTPS